MSPAVHALVDHLFRREAARSVGRLTRLLGPRHLELAEEAVHEALVAALRTWPFRGVPDDPAAWLLATARNRALDHLRREGRFRELAAGRLDELRRALRGVRADDTPETTLPGELTDDELRAVFLCCHPVLSEPSRVALTLKLVGGLSVPEIARALLARETAVAQRLVRAQRTLRAEAETGEVAFEVPSGNDLLERLDSVLAVIYLIFNEGYAASSGDSLVRRELVTEALRLGQALAGEGVLAPDARAPVHALQALMLFGASRLAARVGPEDEVVLLADQDRTLWDRRLTARAFAHLAASAAGARETRYHLEAAIASVHARSVDAGGAGTDWNEIVNLYDRLVALDGSAVARLNRAVAVAQRDGAAAGLAELNELSRDPATERRLAGYHLYHAARGRWLEELGRRSDARRALARAMTCTASEPERRLLEGRLEDLGGP